MSHTVFTHAASSAESDDMLHTVNTRLTVCFGKWHLKVGARNLQGKFPFPSPRAPSSCTCHYCWRVWTTSAARAKRFREWKLKELRSRTYRALGSLKTQQGNLPTKKKMWQYVFRSSIHYKAVWGVNTYARCMLVDGQAAWFGTARENSSITNYGQGWHSFSVLLLCALWAWLRAC